MSFGRPGGFGGGASTPSAPTPQSNQPARGEPRPSPDQRPQAQATAGSAAPFGTFSSDSRGFVHPGAAPPKPEGGGRKSFNDRMGAGTHTAWVDEIASWPGRGLVVKFCNTQYERADWEQQPSEALLREENRTAFQLWTADLVNCYEAAGFPERDWERRVDASGQECRVPPTHAFWWVFAGGVAAPVAFELNLEVNKAGFPVFKSIRPLAGPRLAPMPTTLPRNFRDYLRYPHRDDEFTLTKGKYEGERVLVAKIDRKDAWLSGTGLQSIEDLLPRRRGGG